MVKFIKLTATTGEKIYVNLGNIVAIEPRNRDTGSMLEIHGGAQRAVNESPEHIFNFIEGLKVSK